MVLSHNGNTELSLKLKRYCMIKYSRTEFVVKFYIVQ